MSRPFARRLAIVCGVLCCFALSPSRAGQEASVKPDANTPEMATKDAPAEFKSRVNLVSVPVVVRDNQSHAVGDLTKDDFVLFDNGKPQVISRFSVEKSGGKPAAASAPAGGTSPGTFTLQLGSAGTVPDHFVAYLFDDLHMNVEDLTQARNAASKVLVEGFPPTERAAVYTTSGQVVLEFTDDRAKLQEALSRLQSRTHENPQQTSCPTVSYYMGDLITNKNDPQALEAAEMDAIACALAPVNNRGQNVQAVLQQYQAQAQAAAREAVDVGDQDTRIALQVLKDVIRRTSVMPGQRTVVLASSGFITPQMEQEIADIIDRAIRASVVVSTLDARGLYVSSQFSDASQASTSPDAERLKDQFRHAEDQDKSELLATFADGTGGTFFQNNNDLQEGFRRVASPPEYFYLLAFSPQNLQADGKFHRLKVTLKNSKGFTLQARRGYFSPKRLNDPEEQTRQEIEEAVFSRDDIRDLPVSLHTQFFKTTETDAKLSVLAHVDLKLLHFRKADGRNRNDLIVVSALFDRNGNYVTANSKTVQLRLRDETLESRLASGVTVKTSFDVKVGSYLVRLVVRDAEGQMMAAGTDAVEIQ